MIEAGDRGEHDLDQHDLAQPGFAYRFDWGLDGLADLADHCDVIVVVDVLRFSTAVSAAVEAGASVVPLTWCDERTPEFADEPRAVLTGRRKDGDPSLSPTDLLALRSGVRVVLPSPNGATLAVEGAARAVPFVLAGCLRNATATARRALTLAHGGAIGVIAAGERRLDASPGSTNDGPPAVVRLAVEDLLGAGAVLHALDPSGSISAPCCSPEARAARAAFLDARPDLHHVLAATGTGRDPVRRGSADDVATSAVLDATELTAQLIDGVFVGV